ncbi:hypothetical protein [Ralstonia pickettii]|uniref:hypothetical protein n=1 Tax=Ralstonia pickettii TaxID=329 RepID=UPI0008188912|nr:hypothetical protein [Ralstonia pickettii]OCS48827.1 hypothetical protein BEK67_19610 [Ralstonia pickettii]
MATRQTKKLAELLGRLFAARDAVEAARYVFLVAAGWEHTCDTPGSHWLWQKALPDGRTVLVSAETAVNMQEFLGL